jgi:uncharacterized protein
MAKKNLLQRTLGKKESFDNQKLDYLDIGKLVDEKLIELPPLMFVKVAALTTLSRLDDYLDFVTEGNILILDTGVVGDDDDAMESLVGRLKEFVWDVDGDMAGISSDQIVITPSRVKIDRKKISI